jgi:hypothetical protein
LKVIIDSRTQVPNNQTPLSSFSLSTLNGFVGQKITVDASNSSDASACSTFDSLIFSLTEEPVNRGEIKLVFQLYFSKVSNYQSLTASLKSRFLFKTSIEVAPP